uniref:Uncharacterized protein n=1 Tax=Eutreptiella gymnastica TaxID=73025 RepID=A0A7S1N674_9EUGL|mmetsp:Transcript_127303/g.220302  ORF Transcript_127303/g.220302 Transcript_127303/m.220302 type:complete len:328 (+) Transcript_127303:111-1094(+)
MAVYWGSPPPKPPWMLKGEARRSPSPTVLAAPQPQGAKGASGTAAAPRSRTPERRIPLQAKQSPALVNDVPGPKSPSVATGLHLTQPQSQEMDQGSSIRGSPKKGSPKKSSTPTKSSTPALPTITAIRAGPLPDMSSEDPDSPLRALREIMSAQRRRGERQPDWEKASCALYSPPPPEGPIMVVPFDARNLRPGPHIEVVNEALEFRIRQREQKLQLQAESRLAAQKRAAVTMVEVLAPIAMPTPSQRPSPVAQYQLPPSRQLRSPSPLLPQTRRSAVAALRGIASLQPHQSQDCPGAAPGTLPRLMGTPTPRCASSSPTWMSVASP